MFTTSSNPDAEEGEDAETKEKEEEQKPEDQSLRQDHCSICSVWQKKLGLFIFSILYIPLFAGAFFAFGPMQVMLEESGAFASLCDNDTYNLTTSAPTQSSTMIDDGDGDQEGAVCPEQTARLLTVPFVGQLMILLSPPLGWIVDRFGPMALMSMLSAGGCFGVAMLLIAVLYSIDNLLFVAFICLGLMATAASIMTVKTGMVYADGEVEGGAEREKEDSITTNSGTSSKRKQGRSEQKQSRVISILNTLFDAGSVTYLGLWGMTELGLTVQAVLGIYLALAVFCFGGVLIFWVALGDKAFPEVAAVESELLLEEDKRRITLETTTASSFVDKAHADPESERIDPNSSVVAENAVPVEDTLQADMSGKRDASLNEADSSTAYVLVANRSPREQLLSLPFLMLLGYFAINVALNMFTLTTARDFLAYLSDDEETASQYLTIFTLLMPASVIGLPFTDFIIAKYGFHCGLQIICFLAAVHGIIQVSCDKLNGVQIFGFVVFSFYRCFLFSIVFSYLPTLLNPNVVGKGVSALHFAGGIFAFFNIPLSNVAVKHLGGNFFVPNLVYTILVIPCSMAAWLIGKSIELESRAKGM